MYRFLISVWVVLAGVLFCRAAEVAQVTINGEPVRKAVTAITFDGDQISIHFEDADKVDTDMENVLLSFVSDGSSSVGNMVNDISVFSYDGVVGDVLIVSGISENSILDIHNIAGKTVFGPVAAEGRIEINVSNLGDGVYVLRAGNDVVKFSKH